ncbi:MAG: hypothetical protein LBM16_02710 [Clostridiales bacterium]|jgi:hypothetical protein|nr:hypothetical protein [Clostridiales bacterium]
MRKFYFFVVFLAFLTIFCVPVLAETVVPQQDLGGSYQIPFIFEQEVICSMAEQYSCSREKARKRNYSIDLNTDRAVFVSDKIYQSLEFPIRSGYFFNPAGEYSFTVTTELPNLGGITETAHSEIVTKILNSFRYETNLIYVDCDKKAVTLSGGEVTKLGTTYKPKVTYISADNPLIKTEKSYTITTDDSGKIIEKTTVVITVNPENEYMYTHFQMANTNHATTYYSKAYFEGLPDLDFMEVNVVGSVYDDFYL